MKNITLSVSSFNSPVPAFSSLPPVQLETPKITNVNFSMQFDNEMEALAFVKFMIDNIQNYKAGDV